MEITLKEVETWFKLLPREHQRGVITQLGSHIKPQKGYLTIQKSVEEVGRVMRYCKKHKIVYDAEPKGRTKVRFEFHNLEVRNQVMIGMRTL